jgi:hypothetical protein
MVRIQEPHKRLVLPLGQFAQVIDNRELVRWASQIARSCAAWRMAVGGDRLRDRIAWQGLAATAPAKQDSSSFAHGYYLKHRQPPAYP